MTAPAGWSGKWTWCLRERKSLARAGKRLEDAVGQHEFRQFVLFRQWRAVKAYANARGSDG